METTKKIDKYLNEATQAKVELFNIRTISGDIGKKLKLKKEKVPEICAFCEYYFKEDDECGNGRVFNIVKELIGENPNSIVTREILTCDFWSPADDIWLRGER